MKLLSFIVCERDGNPSTAKIWRHIAFGVITYKVFLLPELSYEMLLAYGAVVGGIELGQRYLHSRDRIHQQGKNNDKQ